MHVRPQWFLVSVVPERSAVPCTSASADVNAYDLEQLDRGAMVRPRAGARPNQRGYQLRMCDSQEQLVGLYGPPRPRHVPRGALERHRNLRAMVTPWWCGYPR